MSRAESFAEDNPVTTVKTHVVARKKALRHTLEPRMAALYQHLRLFVTRMNAQPPKVQIDYHIAGIGTLPTRRAEDFEITADDANRPSRVKVKFTCVAEHSLSVTPESSESFFELRQRLGENKIAFTGATAGNVGKLVCEPRVPVEVRFAARFSSGRIRLRSRNLGALGVRELTVEPKRVDVALIAEIERLMLGEPNQFHRLTGNSVSDAMRQRLRDTLERAKRPV